MLGTIKAPPIRTRSEWAAGTIPAGGSGHGLICIVIVVPLSINFEKSAIFEAINDKKENFSTLCQLR